MKDYYYTRLINFVRLKGYSESTLVTYRSCLETILKTFPEPEKATLLEIQDFAISFTNDNYRRMICVVMRWLFDFVLHKPIDWRDLPFPKRSHKIQPIYSYDEVMKILHATKSPKQKAVLALIVDCGLRVSESLAIDLKDCNSKERSIIIRGAKGDKDRFVYPSQHVWDLIKVYFNTWHRKPTKFLFEGQCKNMPYTDSSIRQFVERSCKICGVEYKGIHAFRRFSITWSHENGASLHALAQRSGHSSTRTIVKFYLNHSPTYLRNVASPLM